MMKNTKQEAKRIYEEIQGGAKEVLNGIRNLIEEGSARRLIIKNKDGEVVFQTQLAFGVGGAALVGAMAPVISAIGMFAMFLNDYQILVEKEITTDEHGPEVHEASQKAKQDINDSDEAVIIEIIEEDEDISNPSKTSESPKKRAKNCIIKEELQKKCWKITDSRFIL